MGGSEKQGKEKGKMKMRGSRWKWKICSWMLLAGLVTGMADTAWAVSGKPLRAEQEEQEEIPVSDSLLWTEETENAGGRAAFEEPLEETFVQEPEAPVEEQHSPEEKVRVFIVMEGDSVTDAGYSAAEIADSTRAAGFSQEMEDRQNQIVKEIAQCLQQSDLEIRYHFTLFSNAVSAVVAYGDIDKIKEIEGVEQVHIVPQYEIQETADTNTVTAGEMIGSVQAWESGYTGAGERIAIIDTGIDADHPSFDPGAFRYGLEMAGQEKKKNISDYHLLGQEEIENVLTQLNAKSLKQDLKGQDVFFNDKIAFGFNYVDRDLNITHDKDSQGDHGTHVAGIAAANQYVPKADGGYEEPANGVMGVAKNAQLLVMKVFGSGGGAYTDDYMAALEDAVLLGADVINMSLGEVYAGESSEYAQAEQYVNEIFEKLSGTDTVVSISAGNTGSWSDNSVYGANRTDDVNMDAIGVPASYTNAFTIGSAQNSGFTGHCVQVGDASIFYDESGSSGGISAFSSLDTTGEGTDYEYVFFDTFGEAEDYIRQDVTGKIVLVSRGVISFSEKHQNAAAAGAAGIFVYNNEPGLSAMSLTDSGVDIPCAMISQTDAQIIEKKGTAGTMKILSQVVTNHSAEDGYQMSDFSSWGVPGDLTLKPELTAPGGNIYSTLDKGTYGNQSGTSMAAPSVAGMSALVSEYIKENGLAEKTGLSIRTLNQSLLMSTAKPLTEEDGEAYSPRKQGSGLANVAAATATPVYLLVGDKEGNDGKVKAELGDDPSRSGVYEFNFTMYNMSDKNQYYTVDSSVMTEQVIEEQFFNGSSHRLHPQVTVNSPQKEKIYDLNGDGQVNREDGLELLRHVNQSVTLDKAEYYTDKFDFNSDGVINTADVHAFLRELEKDMPDVDLEETCVKVEQSTEVSVKITLSGEDRQYLDTYFAHGMYIDGFLYLDGKVPLSLPMLAFYGSWAESSMFEPFDYLTYVNGGAERTHPAYSGIQTANYLTYRLAGDKKDYYYTANMYCSQRDEEYLPDRNAFSPQSGDSFGAVSYSLIRNAVLVRISIVDAKTGEVYYENQEGGQHAAFYHEGEGKWRDTSYRAVLDWSGTDAKGNPLPEGTKVNISVTALPAYYAKDREVTGEGLTWSVPVTMDDTAPKAVDMAETENGKIRITVKDNRYTAAVNVYERDKTTLIDSYAVNQKEAGREASVDISYPAKVFYVKIVDYAGNETVYRVNRSAQEDTEITEGVTLSETTLRLMGGEEKKLTALVEPESILDDTVVWSSSDENIATVDGEGLVKGVGIGTTKITATTNAQNAAGEKETAECEVTVLAPSIRMNGIIWEQPGAVRWAQFSSDHTQETAWLSEAQSNLYMAAAVVGDKVMAATYTTDGNQKSEIYLVDASNSYEAKKVGDTYWCTDMAYSPKTNLMFAVYGDYVHWFDVSNAGKVGVSNFKDVTGGSSLVGIAYAGCSENSQYGPVEWFYAVSQSGTLYQLAYCINEGAFRYADLGNTGISTKSQWYFNSLYYEQDSKTLFWAMYDGGSSAALYALQEKSNAAGNTLIQNYEIGKFPDGQYPAAGLYQPPKEAGQAYQAPEHVTERDTQLLDVPKAAEPEKKEEVLR